MTTTQVARRYRLERLLDEGATAQVHLARDTVLDRPVVVKTLAATREDLHVRFLREGRLAAALSHPNVVRVYDTGEEDGRPYIVAEHVEGEPLEDHLRRQGPLPSAAAAALGAQACAGLAHAHTAGVVHGAVTPRNLLLRADGVLKIADFGLALGGESTTPTEAETVPGGTRYSAPELVRGEPATPAADLYSVGAVLAELLTGRPPAAPPAFPPRTPAALARAVERCLDPDPARRPESAAELAFELEAVVEQHARADAPTRVTRHAPPARRRASPRRLLTVVTGGTAALLAAAALWLTLERGGADPPEPVKPVPAGATPAESARNLSSWLRANAGGVR